MGDNYWLNHRTGFKHYFAQDEDRFMSSNLVEWTLEDLRDRYREPFEAFGFKWTRGAEDCHSLSRFSSPETSLRLTYFRREQLWAVSPGGGAALGRHDWAHTLERALGIAMQASHQQVTGALSYHRDLLRAHE